MSLRLLGIAPALLLAACAQPTGVAVQFHDALAAHNGARAFELLSARTQAELTRAATAAHAVSDRAIPDDPALMIVLGDMSLYPTTTPAKPHVAQATLIAVNGPHAKVSVRIRDATHDMELVRENRRWRVDLPIGRP